MKIIHYRDPFLPVIGGAEIFLNYVGKYFVKKGHQEEKNTNFALRLWI